jgi:vacuolar-type H+-ATPase subunit H
VIPLATQLDLLIDMLEDLNREVQELRRGIIPLLPLPRQSKPAISRASEALDPIISDAYFRAVRRLVQDVEDAPMNLRRNLIEPAKVNFEKAKKVRTNNQKKNDKLQSQAFENANRALRKTNGQMRKGVKQADIARRAQRELRKLKKKGLKRIKR